MEVTTITKGIPSITFIDWGLRARGVFTPQDLDEAFQLGMLHGRVKANIDSRDVFQKKKHTLLFLCEYGDQILYCRCVQCLHTCQDIIVLLVNQRRYCNLSDKNFRSLKVSLILHAFTTSAWRLPISYCMVTCAPCPITGISNSTSYQSRKYCLLFFPLQFLTISLQAETTEFSPRITRS